MKTRRIDFASNDNQCIASVQRKGEYLLAELFSAEVPDGRKHWIGADDADLLFCFLEAHDLPAPQSEAARQAGRTRTSTPCTCGCCRFRISDPQRQGDER